MNFIELWNSSETLSEVCDKAAMSRETASNYACRLRAKGNNLKRFQYRGGKPPLCVKHGHSKEGKHTRCYSAWHMMIQRCTNPNCKSFARYGGRGISVCERWLLFENFLFDMGEPPTTRHSIDRFPNNDGNYEPGNCRWATVKEQANNKSKNHIVVFQGKSLTVQQWAEQLGVKANTLIYRLRRGWSLDRALSQAIQKREYENRG